MIQHIADYELLQANNPEYMLLYRREFDLDELGVKSNKKETFIATVKVTGMSDYDIQESLLRDFLNRGRLTLKGT